MQSLMIEQVSNRKKDRSAAAILCHLRIVSNGIQLLIYQYDVAHLIVASSRFKQRCHCALEGSLQCSLNVDLCEDA
jgi:hypothetical protein